MLDALLRPRSVAIVGASPRAGSAGSNLVANLLAVGFAGPIYPVNPRYAEIHGLRAYASLSEIAEQPDAVYIAVAAEHGPKLVEEALAVGARSILLNAAGYAEAGDGGRHLQDQIAGIAGKGGVPVCGPNNLGLVNLADGVALWTSQMPRGRPGPVAVISQSGSVALALGDDPAGLGLAYLITAGNEAVTGVADYVSALAEDGRVKTILLFLETIRDAAALAKAVAKARAAGQTILAVKVGRSAQARAAVAAHSGAMSGEDAVVDAFFRRHGIRRAASLDDLVQMARLSLLPAPAAGTAPVYVTLSGGQGAAVADFAAAAGMPVADLPAQLATDLSPEFGGSACHNPLDVWGLGWDAERFARIFAGLVAAPAADPIVLALDTPATGGADSPMAAEMLEVAGRHEKHEKTVVLCANSALSGVPEPLERRARELGIPLLRGLDGAMRALAAWRQEAEAPASTLAAPAAPMTRAELDAALSRAVRFAPSVPVASSADAVERARGIGGAVVLKGIAPGALHKTELGLVRVGLASREAVEAGFDDIAGRLARLAPQIGPGHVALQPMIPAGLELLVSARRDPQFGPLVMVGAGGTLVELLADTALRLGPVSRDEARAMIAQTRIGRLLGGYRDSVVYDEDAVLEAVVAVSRIIAAAPADVTSIEINPLIVLPKGQGAVAVDLIVE